MSVDQVVAQEEASDEAAPVIAEDEESEATPEDVERGEDLINRATEAIAAGQTNRALGLCREATEVAPSLAGGWVLLGMVAREAGANREALDAYLHVSELDPGRPDLFETITKLEQAVAEEEEEAAAAAARGPGLIERYSPVLLATSVGILVLALGIVGIVRHNRGAADAQYRQIMEQGYQAMGVQQYDQAEGAFTEALRLRANDPDALAWLENARTGRRKAAEYAQWQYETAGGKYPGAPELPGAVIPSTEDRKAAQLAEQAGGTEGGGGTPGGSYPGAGGGHGYTWQGSERLPGAPGGGGFPSPTAEAPGPTPEGETPGPAPMPVQPQPQPQPVQPPAPQPSAGAGASEQPKGYLHITVGERKPKPAKAAEAAGPTADSLRHQADALRRAGRSGDARDLYQRAMDLYEKEGQSDPQARAVKQAGADYCRRAIEQSR
jgi:tetratricopeptide (TPR) repeat protein